MTRFLPDILNDLPARVQHDANEVVISATLQASTDALMVDGKRNSGACPTSSPQKRRVCHPTYVDWAVYLSPQTCLEFSKHPSSGCASQRRRSQG